MHVFSEPVIERSMDIVALLRTHEYLTRRQIGEMLGLSQAEVGRCMWYLRSQWAPAHNVILGGTKTGVPGLPVATQLIEQVDTVVSTQQAQDSILYGLVDILARIVGLDKAKIRGGVALGVLTKRQGRLMASLMEEAQDQLEMANAKFGQ